MARVQTEQYKPFDTRIPLSSQYRRAVCEYTISDIIRSQKTQPLLRDILRVRLDGEMSLVQKRHRRVGKIPLERFSP